MLARDSWRCYDSLLYRHHAGFPADVSLHPKRSLNLASAYSIVAFAFTLIVTVSMAFEKLFPGSRKHEDNHDQPDVRVHHKHRLRPRSDFWLWPIPGNGELKALRWQPASDRLLTLGDLPCSLSFAANSRAYPQAVHFAQQKDGHQAVFYLAFPQP